MLKLRNIPKFLCVVLPTLTWVACGSDSGDDSSSAGTGGAAAGKGGSGGSTAGKGGGGSAGKAAGGAAGSGALAGAPEETAGEGGSSGEAGAPTVAGTGGTAGTAGTAGGGGAPPDPLANDVDTIVFIYAENRSFDGLYGSFPGAHGLSEVVDGTGTPTAAYVKQKDRDGTTELTSLPKTWGGATAAGNPTVIPEAITSGLANKPFALETGFVAGGGSALTTADVTRDMAHRFFENEMEINGGTNAATTPSTVPRGAPDFQAHHHPYNYYAAFDPASHADARTAHLKDYNVLLTDARPPCRMSCITSRPGT